MPASDRPPADPAAAREDPSGGPPERIPFMQQVLDNPFLLLFIGVALPAILYVIWGVMEVANIPIAR